ncbi:DUF2752 domain-containing protein [Eudoraea chungangensis]|uniref:DUF2752 domain-containing protein n=1 Tax=Eudoraea chungangensis TaxID=1481905 RepID=UPI0023EB9C0C|nr:DUF2752 domain-containing protein [Eudoraea chungangensis]
MFYSLRFVFFEGKMLPCINKQILGFECPGCGLQRAFAFLIEGEFLQAFYMYPAIYPLMLLMAVIIMDQFFSLKFANKLIIFLAITAVGSILINYALKFI